jgi:DNA-directed RNA polymerase subunit RPC12/RpoP
MFSLVGKQKCELEGPYECGHCGGHLMMDATFLDQVGDIVVCPYCGAGGMVVNNEEEANQARAIHA